MKELSEINAIARIGSSTVAIAILVFSGIGLGGANLASAQLNYDDNVTPDVIFGGGNANGSFTTRRNNGVELGIRAKIPFVGTTNSNGDGTYPYSLAETATCPGGTKCWNFDWTVNTDFAGSTGNKIDDYTYEMGIDANPGVARQYLVFDPITPTVAVPLFDHAFGDNLTGNGAGVEAVDAADYLSLMSTSNVAQNSWRNAYFSTLPPMDTYDPDVSGIYGVYLLARDKASGTIVARVDIRILIEVPPQETWLRCVGFEPPMNQAYLPPALGGGEIGRKVKKNKVLPFKAELFDPDDLPVVAMESPPEILVLYVSLPPEGIVLVDVTEDALSNGKRTEGTQFVVISGDTWSYNLATRGFNNVAGQYYVLMESGDIGAYVIDPSCIGLFVIEE